MEELFLNCKVMNLTNIVYKKSSVYIYNITCELIRKKVYFNFFDIVIKTCRLFLSAYSNKNGFTKKIIIKESTDMESEFLKKMKIVFLPLVLSSVIMYICYPGFMSYDSVRMLEEARSIVRGGMYPPTPVYILRFFDLTGFGVPLMVFTQNFIILFAVSFLLRMLKVSEILTMSSLLILLSMPTVIGCMLVLWKDVTLTSILMLSMILILTRNKQSNYMYSILKWVSFFLLSFSTLVRFNAISASLVILVYWIFAYFKDVSRSRKITYFVVSTIVIFSFNNIINNYRLPTFEKLDKNNLVYGIMAYDLVGTSKWARMPLIPFHSNQSIDYKEEISKIDSIYSSLGSESIKVNARLSGLQVRVFPDKYSENDLINAWVAAITEHTNAYLRYRWDLFSEIIGATNHATFEPTHFNRIDENKFGIIFHDRTISTLLLNFISFSSAVLICKPWFVMSIGLLCYLLILRNKTIESDFRFFAYASFYASFFYIIPFFFITGTGEVRYSYPTILLSFNCIVVWFFARNQNRELL